MTINEENEDEPGHYCWTPDEDGWNLNSVWSCPTCDALHALRACNEYDSYGVRTSKWVRLKV